jgi:hypothetical protein
VPVLRDEREWRGDLEGGEPAEFLRCVGNELPEEVQDSAGVLQLVEDRPTVDVLDGTESELEGGNHAEIS